MMLKKGTRSDGNKPIIKEIQIVNRLFLVLYYLLQEPLQQSR